MKTRRRLIPVPIAALGLVLGALSISSHGCESADDVEDALRVGTVTGAVFDDHGQPLVGATVSLYSLLENTDFVIGGDVRSATAQIDKEAVSASSNAFATVQTGADGRFLLEDALPGAFFAVARTAGCADGFAGFDEETGALNLDTLIVPDANLQFDVPTFVLPCATPPEVGPDGNSAEAPPFEPPPGVVACDGALCEGAGGVCESAVCVVTCQPGACAESGGTCIDGVCEAPACNEAACAAVGGSCDGSGCVVGAGCDPVTCTEARGACSTDGTRCEIPPCYAAEAECVAAGGTCSDDGTKCRLPACRDDADCAAGQPGAFCTDPGDVELAACNAPLPDELVAPPEVTGWTLFRLTDTANTPLADATTSNQVIAAEALPVDGLVRVEATLDGAAPRAWIHVQSGGQGCAGLPPRTDSIAVELVDGRLTSGAGDPFVELFVHGGYQKISVSTSETVGEGERSFVVELGAPCAPPAYPFVALLSWDAGPGAPADLDLSVWSGAGELVFAGSKQAAWGQLAREDRQGPGPEVFRADDAAQGPFTLKVQFFSGRPRAIVGKVRILRTVEGVARDETFAFTVERPKDVAEIGVFASE